MKTCQEEGCERRVRCRGMCSMHYDRWRYRHSPTRRAYVEERAKQPDVIAKKRAADKRYCARPENREKARKRASAHYAANKDSHLEYTKKYKLDNADRVRKWARDAYARNPAHKARLKRAWRDRHPDYFKETNRKRRNLYAGLPGWHSEFQWKLLCAMFGDRCCRCGSDGRLTRDHVVPVSMAGSTDDISNIQPMCRSCNSSKCNRESFAYRPFGESE